MILVIESALELHRQAEGANWRTLSPAKLGRCDEESRHEPQLLTWNKKLSGWRQSTIDCLRPALQRAGGPAVAKTESSCRNVRCYWAELASVFTEKKNQSQSGMTGEISTDWKVMPVGGIKEKILAAAAEIKRIILWRNKRDIEADWCPTQRHDFNFVDRVERGLDIELVGILNTDRRELEESRLTRRTHSKDI